MARVMKDSGIEWIGEIPEGWESKTLKYVSTFMQTKYVDSYGTLPYIGLENIVSWNGSFIETDSQYDREQSLICEPGDILFGKLRPYLAKVYMNPELQCCSGEFAVIRIQEQYTRYMWYQLLSHGFIFTVDRSTYGTKMPRANADFIKNIPIVVPTLSEQHRIADFLDRKCAEIDAVIEKTKATIEEYKKLKQSVITEAVTKGIRGNRPMNDSGIEWIGEICDTYQVYRLKHLVSEALMYGANESGIPFEADLPRYIRITDITLDGHLKDEGKLSLPESVAEPYLLKNNDILFARSGATVGKAFIYKQEYGRAAFAGYLIKANVNELVCADYVFYYTQSSLYEEWKKQIFVQATIQNIGADRYNNLPVILPDVDEQHEIIAYLDKKCAVLDALIAKKAALLTELETYKKSLIYEYITGKKEVIA